MIPVVRPGIPTGDWELLVGQQEPHFHHFSITFRSLFDHFSGHTRSFLGHFWVTFRSLFDQKSGFRSLFDHFSIISRSLSNQFSIILSPRISKRAKRHVN